MSPEIWGKYGWDFLHLVIMGYPEKPTEEDKMYYYQYMQLLPHVLPCTKCGKNLMNHLRRYPLTNEILSNKSKFIKWSIDLHNIVNYYIGKPMLTYAEAMNEINKLINPKKPNYTIYYILAILVVAIVCYLLYHRARKN